MVQKGDDVLVLTDGLGLLESPVSKSDEVVVHKEGLARGPSNVTKGDNVVLVSESLCQGPGGALAQLDVGKITASDRLVTLDTKVRLFVPVTNTGDSDVDYTQQFTENGSDFKTDSDTVKAGDTKAFAVSSTKSTGGNWIYSGDNIANDVGVAWFTGIDPGPIKTDKGVLQLGGTVTVSIDVGNVSSSDLDAKVDFRENGGIIATNTKTVPAGGTETFSTTVTKSSETSVDFSATVEEIATGISGTTNPKTVYWTDDTTSYTGVYIGDSEMSSGPDRYYMNNGDTLPSGTYVVSVTGNGWSHFASGSLRPPYDTRYEDASTTPSEPYAIYAGGSVIFGPAICWDGGPYDTGGGPGTYQEDILNGGSGTVTLDNSSDMWFFNMDTEGDYSDNRADLQYSLEKIPDRLT